ncbi:MAG: hypothetical protein MJA32_01595 [Proteobacteria bacterium]|nr:hypothetical protein [Pseudomonadota bacterium]
MSRVSAPAGRAGATCAASIGMLGKMERTIDLVTMAVVSGPPPGHALVSGGLAGTAPAA